MKHLGVKTRAVDSKKSRGGFFRRQLVKVQQEKTCSFYAWPQCFYRELRLKHKIALSIINAICSIKFAFNLFG